MTNNRPPSQSMKLFKFNKEIISEVITEIRRARKFIKIAIFQLHDQTIFEELNKKPNP